MGEPAFDPDGTMGHYVDLLSQIVKQAGEMAKPGEPNAAFAWSLGVLSATLGLLLGEQCQAHGVSLEDSAVTASLEQSHAMVLMMARAQMGLRDPTEAH